MNKEYLVHFQTKAFVKSPQLKVTASRLLFSLSN